MYESDMNRKVRDADLRDADLSGANLTGADMPPYSDDLLGRSELSDAMVDALRDAILSGAAIMPDGWTFNQLGIVGHANEVEEATR